MASEQEWQVQRACTDVENYELIVEKQKTSWNCEQKQESWKWRISYHGSVVASGSVNDFDLAKAQAEANIPKNVSKN